MTIASISLLRIPFSVTATRHRFSSVILAGVRRHQNPNNVSKKLQSKNLLKARETLTNKHFSTLAPILTFEDKPRLSHDQAVGTVASSQANFMRVIVHEVSRRSDEEPSGSFDGEINGIGLKFPEASRRTSGSFGAENELGVDSKPSGSFGDDDNKLGVEFPEASRRTRSFGGENEVGVEVSGRTRSFGGENEVGVGFPEVSRQTRSFKGENQLGVEFSEASRRTNSEPSRSFGGEIEIGVELLCVVKAVLKKIKRRVLVGDKVLVGSIDWVDKRGAIENVFQRKTEILDPPVANVDHLVVLFSMDQPKIEPYSLTRFLVEAESTGIPLTLALNKSELVSEEEIKAWKSRFHSWGYEPIFCSMESKRGLDTLQFIMREQTSVIVGPSGVGKSSLINALRGIKDILGAVEEGNWFDPLLGSKWYEEQRVGEVSVRSGRGKHTTRHVSLLPLPDGGYLADTPGFNQPSLIKVTKNSLPYHFPEIRKMLTDSEPAKCAFNNCLHLGEPGCLVKSDWERYPYYLQLLDEIKIREEFQLRTIGTKRESDVRCKVGERGVVQTEPRLEPKKYRRQSRKRVNQSFLDELDDDDDDNETLEDENPILRAMREENQ